MEFSEHYPPFDTNTLIILTNTEHARLLSARGRDVTELPDITITVKEQDDFDALKAAQLSALGKALTTKITSLLQTENFHDIILCIPEVNREQLIASLDDHVLQRISTIIPKNLSAMDLPVIMRIVLEH